MTVIRQWPYESAFRRLVKSPMYPFRPGSVILHSFEDLDFFRYVFYIEFPDINLKLKTIFDRDVLLDSTDPVQCVAQTVFNTIRFFPRLEPESNIILGEN